MHTRLFISLFRARFLLFRNMLSTPAGRMLYNLWAVGAMVALLMGCRYREHVVLLDLPRACLDVLGKKKKKRHYTGFASIHSIPLSFKHAKQPSH
jgi:hypothetical protein